MPFDMNKIQRLEKLLVRTDIPVQKKTGLDRSIGRVEWLRDNFDVRNADHSKRDEIMDLVKEILE
jgi:hypothetical protein